jgi:uncharacterized protein
MLTGMKRLLTEPAAAAVIVIDEAGGATMSEIARASDRSVSTIQRAVQALAGGGVIRHTTPRGPLAFRPDAPKRALRELAGWTLGRARTRQLAEAAGRIRMSRETALPPTVKDRAVKAYLPRAIDSIVERYDPLRVILFGSQARGTATDDSDVDLLVVFDRQVDRRERQVEIRRLLQDAPFPKDVLVASTEDLPKAARGTALSEAAHDGLVVYER